MKLRLLAIILLSLATQAYASCDRYFITYVEVTDFTGKARDSIVALQREDFRAIFAGSSKPFPSKCQFYINGEDLKKDSAGESKLTKIYHQIANDNSDAPLDFLTLTHGQGDARIEVARGKTESLEKAFFDDMPAGLKKRLGVFADFACYGIESRGSAIRAGFAAALGIQIISLGPLLSRDFIKNYLEGKTLKDVAEELNFNCLNDGYWRNISRVVSDNHEEYCKEAAVKILGNPELTIDHKTSDMKVMKEEVIKSGTTVSYQANERLRNSFITRITGTVQGGDNASNQIDFYTKNSFITRLSVTTSGKFGYQFGLMNQPHGKLLSFERDPKNNILFSFTAFSLDKNLFSTGKELGNGLTWKYNLSAEGKLGYLKVETKDDTVKSMANIGAKLNNEVRIGYRALTLEANAGRDFLLLHRDRNYANGSLNVHRNGHSVGAYATFDSLTGARAGIKASISIKRKKRK